MRHKLLLLYLFLIFLFCPAGAESYHTFKNIALPVNANQVNVVFQDYDGMVWLGTRRGLYSYNGYDIHHSDEAHTDFNGVFTIIQVDDCLYLGTDVGVRAYNLMTQRFEAISSSLMNVGEVRSLVLYDGHLWVGTREKGLFRFDFSSQSFEEVALDGLYETTIYYLEPAGDKLFVASYEYLSCYDSNSGKRTVMDLGCQERIMVNSLLWDKTRGSMWVGTEGYLYEYSIIKDQITRKPFLAGNSFKALSFDSEGSLLMGTDAGLFVLDLQDMSWRQVVHDSRNSMSLGNNIIWDIHCDRYNNVWLATDRGVSLFQTDTGQHYVHLSEIVQSGAGNLFAYMSRDSYGDRWFGGENGLIHIEGELLGGKVDWFRQGSDDHSLRHNRIRHIYEDTSHNIWIASDGGVARYDRQSDRFQYYHLQVESTGQNAGWAYAIAEDAAGRIWIASYMGGVFVCDRNSMEIIHNFDESSGVGNNVYLMQAGADGKMWVNCNHGLVSIDTETYDVRIHKISLDNMLCSGESVWYSHSGKLYRYDVASSTSENIPISGSCRQIYTFVQENGNIWFTSSEGVFRIDQESLTLVKISHSAEPYSCGLYEADNNQILFGGEDCITYFTLGRGPRRSSPDSLYIAALVSDSGVMSPGEDYVKSGDHIQLKHNEDFAIELTSYTYQSDETYYYRFGKNGQWHALGRNVNKISLVDRFGGNIVLQLSCSDPDSVSDAAISTYYIMIPYPWLLSWEAFLLYVLVIGGVVLVIFRIRVERKKRLDEIQAREKFLESVSISESQKHKSADERFLEKVNKAIEENMGKEDFSVALLAEMVSVDSKQLYRKLKQLADTTPVNYIKRIRLMKAAVLLKQERFTVSEVMFLVGYSNPSYFSKCFTEQYGMSPKEYAACKGEMSK